jgi:hypothetical protein
MDKVDRISDLVHRLLDLGRLHLCPPPSLLALLPHHHLCPLGTLIQPYHKLDDRQYPLKELLLTYPLPLRLAHRHPLDHLQRRHAKRQLRRNDQLLPLDTLLLSILILVDLPNPPRGLVYHSTSHGMYTITQTYLRKNKRND